MAAASVTLSGSSPEPDRTTARLVLQLRIRADTRTDGGT